MYCAFKKCPNFYSMYCALKKVPQFFIPFIVFKNSPNFYSVYCVFQKCPNFFIACIVPWKKCPSFFIPCIVPWKKSTAFASSSNSTIKPLKLYTWVLSENLSFGCCSACKKCSVSRFLFGLQNQHNSQLLFWPHLYGLLCSKTDLFHFPKDIC